MAPELVGHKELTAVNSTISVRNYAAGSESQVSTPGRTIETALDVESSALTIQAPCIEDAKLVSFSNSGLKVFYSVSAMCNFCGSMAAMRICLDVIHAFFVYFHAITLNIFEKQPSHNLSRKFDNQMSAIGKCDVLRNEFIQLHTIILIESGRRD